MEMNSELQLVDLSQFSVRTMTGWSLNVDPILWGLKTTGFLIFPLAHPPGICPHRISVQVKELREALKAL